jgi:ADP-heptose:LPS heptosyltransferase
LKWATITLGNFFGIMHLAAMLGIPTVAMFGSTEPDWTRDFRCMTGIDAETVAREAIEMLTGK